jgi:hypothetical protein
MVKKLKSLDRLLLRKNSVQSLEKDSFQVKQGWNMDKMIKSLEVYYHTYQEVIVQSLEISGGIEYRA